MRRISIPLTMAIVLATFTTQSSWAQSAPTPQNSDGEAASDISLSQDDLRRLASEAANNQEQSSAAKPDAGMQSSLNFLGLLIDGGPLMIPIALMSLLVVTMSLERFFALRRGRLLPGGLRREIRRASQDIDGMSPEALWKTSEKYTSATSRILQDVLLKSGRPIPEAEAAISEGAQREADKMYANVRWLTLAAGVTPLIGLLGTVWGMILAFYNTTQLGAGMNKAEHLAEGIYVALVTTLGGLAVAIPAAIFAHYFEGRITRMVGKIESELHRLIPRLEALECKTRYDFSAQGFTQRETQQESPSVSPPAAKLPKSRKSAKNPY